MQTSYEMFLLAAKTLNFTKAASLAHITQQSFSEHIKKLEKKLEPCFLRGLPALHSPNRAAFLRNRTANGSYRTPLPGALKGAGSRNAGTCASWHQCGTGQMFSPRSFERYHKAYPAVTVETVLGDTRELEPLLEEGRLDVLLGVDCTESALFHRIPVGTEALYLVGNREYVKGHLKKDGQSRFNRGVW